MTRPLVLLQVHPLPHHHPALVARHVHPLLVPLQHPHLYELLVAVRTLERLLLGVYPQVLLQVVRPQEAHPAQLAPVLLLVRVRHLVVLESALAPEPLVAHLALERLLPGVDPLVVPQRLLARELLLADLAHYPLSVLLLVDLEGGLLDELHAAGFALELDHVGVGVLVVVELELGGEPLLAVVEVALDVLLGGVLAGLVAREVAVELELRVVAVAADAAEVVEDVGLEVADVVGAGTEDLLAHVARDGVAAVLLVLVRRVDGVEGGRVTRVLKIAKLKISNIPKSKNRKTKN